MLILVGMDVMRCKGLVFRKYGKDVVIMSMIIYIF